MRSVAHNCNNALSNQQPVAHGACRSLVHMDGGLAERLDRLLSTFIRTEPQVGDTSNAAEETVSGLNVYREDSVSRRKSTTQKSERYGGISTVKQRIVQDRVHVLMTQFELLVNSQADGEMTQLFISALRCHVDTLISKLWVRIATLQDSDVVDYFVSTVTCAQLSLCVCRKQIVDKLQPVQEHNKLSVYLITRIDKICQQQNVDIHTTMDMLRRVWQRDEPPRPLAIDLKMMRLPQGAWRSPCGSGGSSPVSSVSHAGNWSRLVTTSLFVTHGPLPMDAIRAFVSQDSVQNVFEHGGIQTTTPHALRIFANSAAVALLRCTFSTQLTRLTSLEAIQKMSPKKKSRHDADSEGGGSSPSVDKSVNTCTSPDESKMQTYLRIQAKSIYEHVKDTIRTRQPTFDPQPLMERYIKAVWGLASAYMHEYFDET